MGEFEVRAKVAPQLRAGLAARCERAPARYAGLARQLAAHVEGELAELGEVG